ncbi:MAG: hypothetical protein A4E72_00820 [Syntrophus sp. PtaU1.Bin208]|nr:MAG: hypothetical protein A4E72_00820 [Syntrophus sp. PtaU1.Bin208]
MTVRSICCKGFVGDLMTARQAFFFSFPFRRKKPTESRTRTVTKITLIDIFLFLNKVGNSSDFTVCHTTKQEENFTYFLKYWIFINFLQTDQNRPFFSLQLKKN